MSKLKNKIAGAYTSFLRAVTEPVMLAALERPEGRTGITECLYERIQNRLLVGSSSFTRTGAVSPPTVPRRSNVEEWSR